MPNSLWISAALYFTYFMALGSYAPKAIIRRTSYEPVVGAALLTLEIAGKTIDWSLYQQLDETLPEQLKYQDLDDKLAQRDLVQLQTTSNFMENRNGS